VTQSGWEAIDAAERAAGEPHGRPRVKLSEWEALLAVAAGSDAALADSSTALDSKR
jgi:ferredoxin--NADP+ reductase